MTLKSGVEVSHSRSLKLVPFESLGAVSYLLLTVSVADVRYLASKNDVTLKNKVTVRFVQSHWK